MKRCDLYLCIFRNKIYIYFHILFLFVLDIPAITITILLNNVYVHISHFNCSAFRGKWVSLQCINISKTRTMGMFIYDNDLTLIFTSLFYRDSRECRIKTVIHNPVSFTTSAAETSVMFQVSRMATNGGYDTSKPSLYVPFLKEL